MGAPNGRAARAASIGKDAVLVERASGEILEFLPESGREASDILEVVANCPPSATLQRLRPFPFRFVPLAHDSAPLQRPKTLPASAENPPRRLNRSAKLRRFKLPKGPTTTTAEIPRTRGSCHDFCTRRRPCFVFGCSAASAVRRGCLAASEVFSKCAHCRAG